MRSPSESTGESDEEENGSENVRGGAGGHGHHQHHQHHGQRQMMGEGMLAHPGVENNPVHNSGGALHKSISTPSMAQGELANHHAGANKSK